MFLRFLFCQFIRRTERLLQTTGNPGNESKKQHSSNGPCGPTTGNKSSLYRPLLLAFRCGRRRCNFNGECRARMTSANYPARASERTACDAGCTSKGSTHLLLALVSLPLWVGPPEASPIHVNNGSSKIPHPAPGCLLHWLSD